MSSTVMWKLVALALVAVAGTQTALADDPVSGVLVRTTAYVRVREELAPTVALSRAELDRAIEQDRARVVEICGAVAGTASCPGALSSGEIVTVALDLEDGGTTTLRAGSDVNALRIGELVCMIGRVPPRGTRSGDLRVKAWVRKWDLPEELRPRTQTEIEEPRPAPAAPPTAVTPPTEPATPPAGGGLPDPAAETAYQLQSMAVWRAWVLEQNPKLTDEQAENIVKWVLLYSQRHDVNHRLIFALIKWESWFDPSCVSRSGAIGLTQLMPGTARYMRVDPWNVQQNIEGGVHYLAEQLATYANRPNYERVILALACYNAGPNAVKRAGGVPNIAETQSYVRKVSATFKELHDAGYP